MHVRVGVDGSELAAGAAAHPRHGPHSGPCLPTLRLIVNA